MNQKDIGKLFSFKFQYTDCEEIYSGYLIDFNKDWTLIKYNSADYVVDGYIILKNKYVTAHKRDNQEKFTQKILDLKGQKPTSKEKIPLTDLKTIFKYLSSKYGLFQFDMKTSKSCWIGKVKRITDSEMKIDYLTPKATWSTTMPPYKLGNIRTIRFNHDYLHSLLLIAKKKK